MSSRRVGRVPVVITALLGVGAAAFAADAPVLPATGAASWTQVSAIFERACVHCHGGDRPVNGLALDGYAGLMKGAGGRAVVVAGAPEKSSLIGRLRGEITPQMPFAADPLPPAEIAIVEAWIRAGAPAPQAEPAPAAAPVVPPDPVDPPAPLRWSDVRPILRASCVRCHQTNGLRGPAPEGIRFETYEATVGAGLVTVVPGRPDASPLVRAVDGRARKRMPLDGPPDLRPAEIATLTRWVRDGARGDDGLPAPRPVGREVRLFGTFDGLAAVDGIALVFDASSRRDDRVGAGATVEVRATVTADGALRVSRLRARHASDGVDDGSGHRGGDDRREGDDHHGGDDRRGGDDDGDGDDRRGRGR